MSSEEKIPQPTIEAIKIPTTVNEGFEEKPPTLAEKSVWDQRKAEVRRSHENSDADSEKPWFKRTITKIGASALVLVATGATVFGLMSPNGDETKDIDGPRENTGTGVEQVEPEVMAPLTFEQEMEALLAIELPEHLKKYEAMLPAEFDTYPIEERKAYVSYLTRDRSFVEDIWYNVTNNPNDRAPEQITKNSTPQEIVTESGYNFRDAFISRFGGAAVYDRDTLQKIISAGFYSPIQDPDYQVWTDIVSQDRVMATPNVVAEQGDIFLVDYLNSGSESYVINDDGKELTARDINKAQGGIGDTFVYVEYTDYKGDTQQTYVTYPS